MSYPQIIYNRLRQAGMTEAGALGVIGNFDCESNCEPCRVQNDNSSYRTISKAYVNSLRVGKLTREAFSVDKKGFGLAQWTYPDRKYELYNEWKKSGKAIDDVNFQMDFAVMEFKRDFAKDFNLLCKTYDIYEAVKAVCDRFENPRDKNYDARFRSATRIKFEIDLNAWEKDTDASTTPSTPSTTPPSGWENVPATEYWPPRMICKGMSGYDIMVLQSVLKARGYAIEHVDGEFGGDLDELVRTFQKTYELDVDGIVGNQTWGKLLERR